MPSGGAFRSLIFKAILLLMFVSPVPLGMAAWRGWQVSSQFEWWALTLAASGYTLTLHLTLNWAQTSLALRPVLWFLLALILGSGTRLDRLPPGHLTGWSVLLLLLAVLVFLPAVVRAWQARREPPGSIALGPVLAGGTFLVDQGGGREIVNYHMRYAALRYAVDFIGVGRAGRHANGFLPADPHRYAIFEADVLAPCDAVVTQASDDLPDLPVPQTDPQHLAGNLLILRAATAPGAVHIALGHLKQGSLRVHVGQRVRAGQVVAQVGNSGNTTEPHLHLGVFLGEAWQGEGLPFTLAGQFPAKGMIFRG